MRYGQINTVYVIFALAGHINKIRISWPIKSGVKIEAVCGQWQKHAVIFDFESILLHVVTV